MQRRWMGAGRKAGWWGTEQKGEKFTCNSGAVWFLCLLSLWIFLNKSNGHYFSFLHHFKDLILNFSCNESPRADTQCLPEATINIRVKWGACLWLFPGSWAASTCLPILFDCGNPCARSDELAGWANWVVAVAYFFLRNRENIIYRQFLG